MPDRQPPDGEAAQTPDDTGRFGVYGGVDGARQAREIQVQIPQRPGDVYVLRVTGPATWDDGDLIEPVRPPARLAFADLNVHAN